MYACLCQKMMEQISPDVQDNEVKNPEGKPIVGGHSAAAVRFSPVQRGFHENRKPNLGPVLPDLMNPELDRCERFGTVRFGFFLVRTQTEPKFFLEVKKKVSTSQK